MLNSSDKTSKFCTIAMFELLHKNYSKQNVNVCL